MLRTLFAFTLPLSHLMISNNQFSAIETEMNSEKLNCLVVGGGPAGMCFLLAARKSGLLNSLLANKIQIIEKSARIGTGEIGDYAIRSGSFADSFMASVFVKTDPQLEHLLTLPAGKQMHAALGQPVELSLVSKFLADIGVELRLSLKETDYDPFIIDQQAVKSQQQQDGSWLTECINSQQESIFYHSNTLVLCSGAEQTFAQIKDEPVAGAPLLPRFADKTILSSQLLRHDGNTLLSTYLSGKNNPKIAIVGGSHSGISCANYCLNNSVGLVFAPGSISILHKYPIRLTYVNPEAALAEGYTDFGAEDICPKTGKVYPLAGFRADSRDLLRKHWGLGMPASENRFQLFKMDDSNAAAANQLLEEADLIIAALGYRPRALPLFDVNHSRIKLQADSKLPLVDAASRVIDAEGQPIPGVFAMGLSAGYPLAGVHGEPSFKGEANGLSLWQSDIGAQIAQQVLDNLVLR